VPVITCVEAKLTAKVGLANHVRRICILPFCCISHNLIQSFENFAVLGHSLRLIFGNNFGTRPIFGYTFCEHFLLPITLCLIFQMNLIWTTALRTYKLMMLPFSSATLLRNPCQACPGIRYSGGLGNVSAIRIGWSAFLIETQGECPRVS
jgi:hypothetical protein